MKWLKGIAFITFSAVIIFASTMQAAGFQQQELELDNPMDVEYLKQHLKKQRPRLVIIPQIKKKLEKDLQNDRLVKSFYETLKSEAQKILQEPLIERRMVGRRMSTGEIRQRLTTLGMVYQLSEDPEILDRINQEVLAVCNFPDWNPSHFLDVAGASISVALAIDWAGNDLPAETVEIAKESLIEKGIRPSFNEEYNWWVESHHNWNQVCHAGMVASALTIADKNPELAAKTISRALDKMPLALQAYSPDGVYPEGVSYWGYGTLHTVMTVSMFKSAFGEDFGITESLGFMESANVIPLLTAPSGEYYNFYDCGSNMGEDKRGKGDASVAMFNSSSIVANLTWFAAHTGNPLYFDKSYFTDESEDRRRNYFDGALLVWLSQYEPGEFKTVPSVWKGEGINPVVVFRDDQFRGDNHDSEMFYLGAKGGKGSNNHGNLDAGSFIFELDGVRWGIDLGNQNYNELEQAGFDLWNSSQDSERWTLLTKGNQGHSTLTINNERHNVDGFAPIVDFEKGNQREKPKATFDLSEVLKGQLKSAERTFIKEGPRSLLIEDHVVLNEATEMITWQMITTAKVDRVEGGAVLKQDGKQLKLENLSHPDIPVSVIALDPPPLKLDKQIENLKRIEIRVPTWIFEGNRGEIKVRLTGK